MNPQEAVPGGDADYGSMFETELSPTSKGDNSTDLSWSSTPVSFHISAILTNIIEIISILFHIILLFQLWVSFRTVNYAKLN